MFTGPMKVSKTFCNFPDYWPSNIFQCVGSLNVHFLTDKFRSQEFVYNQILNAKLIFYFNSVSSNSVTRIEHDVSAATPENFTFTK
jgi:hypothetical protein